MQGSFAFRNGEATVRLVMSLTKKRGWNVRGVDGLAKLMRRRKAAVLSYQEKWGLALAGTQRGT